MGVAGLVVDERALARRVLDVALADRDPLGPSALYGQLEDVQRRARVAAGPLRDQRDELGRQLRVELGGAAPDDRLDVFEPERLELVELHAREKGRVDLEVRVLRGRADQRDEALLDRRQERVLLGLVEAVDLVQEEDRATTLAAEPVTGALENRPHVADGRRHGRELLERRSGRRGDDSRERGLAAAGRAVEDA